MKKHLLKICAIALVILLPLASILSVNITMRKMAAARIDLDPENIESCTIPLWRVARRTLKPTGDYPLTESESEQLIEYLNDIVQNRPDYKIRDGIKDGGYHLFWIHCTDGSSIFVDSYSTRQGKFLRIDGLVYNISPAAIEAMYDACYERILQEPNREELVIK